MDRNTPFRGGGRIPATVAAGVEVHQGSMVVWDNGGVRHATKAAGLVFAGIADESSPASEETTIVVKRGEIAFYEATGILPADVGKTAYVEDEKTVTKVAAGSPPVGEIIVVEDAGVWVDHGAASPVVAGGAGGGGLAASDVDALIDARVPRGELIAGFSDDAAGTNLTESSRRRFAGSDVLLRLPRTTATGQRLYFEVVGAVVAQINSPNGSDLSSRWSRVGATQRYVGTSTIRRTNTGSSAVLVLTVP